MIVAVEIEDVATIERLIKSWCRINIRKNKSLRDVADETGNIEIVKMLRLFESRNEAVCLALACHSEKLREFLKTGMLIYHLVLQCHDNLSHGMESTKNSIFIINITVTVVQLYLDEIKEIVFLTGGYLM